MRTARDVPTPLLCRNSMISRITFCSAQPAMIRSARCLVRFDNNNYSVAARAVGRPVEIQTYVERTTSATCRSPTRASPEAAAQGHKASQNEAYFLRRERTAIRR